MIMRGRRHVTAVTVSALLVAWGLSALGASLGEARGEREFKAALSGYNEVLSYTEADSGHLTPRQGAVHSAGKGQFKALLMGGELRYALEYEFPAGTTVQQAHIHFGQPFTVGGIVVFLCTNLGNDPTGLAPACPTPSGRVTGTLTSASVIAVVAQGFPAGDLDALIAALRNDAGYVNVHTAAFPAGEIRGQVE
jgi:hypothetical protein